MCGDLHPVALGFKVSMDGKLLKARMAPETDAPSEDCSNHKDQWQEDPLRCSASCWPEESNKGKLQAGMVFGVDFDDVGDGGAANQLLPFFARSVGIRRGRHSA